MDTEVVVAFALGMMFHHGIVSRKEERVARVLGVLAVVHAYQKALRAERIKAFIRSIPAENNPMFGSVFLCLGVLMCVETLIMSAVSDFVPKGYVAFLERLGGACIAVGVGLVFSSVWMLSQRDISECTFIEQGVYMYVRHPYYLGVMLLFWGCAFTLTDVVTVGIAHYVLQERVAELVRAEEEFITHKNKRYAGYRQRVWSGIPVRLQHKEGDVLSGTQGGGIGGGALSDASKGALNGAVSDVTNSTLDTTLESVQSSMLGR